MNTLSKYKTHLFIFLILSISAVFVTRAFDAAAKKDFWTDEEMTLNISVREHGWKDILVGNIYNQGSAAPLDYLVIKGLDRLRVPLKSLGLPFNVYYRLPSIFYSFASGLIAVWMVFFRINEINRDRPQNRVRPYLFQVILLCAALGLYYFMPQNFHFSIETRPYALWNALWFIAMAYVLTASSWRWPLTLCLSFLALTATASVFQLFCLGVSFVGVSLIKINGDRPCLGVSPHLFQALWIFTLPTLICLYYILTKTQTWGYPDKERYIAEFYYFWTHSQRIGLLAGLGIIISFFMEKHRGAIIVFLTILLLYCISPLINYVTVSKGVYFTPRQYRYYALVYPLFLMALVTLKKVPGKKTGLIPFALGLLVCFFLGRSFYNDYGVDKMKRLNQHIPESYAYLIEIARNPQEVDQTQLKAYQDYYKLLVEYMPYRGDAYGMLGFCNYHAGQPKKAVAAYKSAIIRQKDFFWFHYNLGVLYYKMGQYAKAAQSLEKALTIDQKETFQFILSSKRIYQPILLERQINKNQFVGQQMWEGYRDSCILLEESYHHMGKHEQAAIFSERAKVLIRKNVLEEIEANQIDLELY